MKRSGQGSSRRRFMKQAVLGAGATATLGAGMAPVTARFSSLSKRESQPTCNPTKRGWTTKRFGISSTT